MEQDISLTISSHVPLIKLELALSRFELKKKVKWLRKKNTYTRNKHKDINCLFITDFYSFLHSTILVPVS